MKIIKNIFTRVGECIVESFSFMFGTACNLIAVLWFSLALHFVPVWFIATVIILLLLVVIYFTYKDELDSIKESDD